MAGDGLAFSKGSMLIELKYLSILINNHHDHPCGGTCHTSNTPSNDFPSE